LTIGVFRRTRYTNDDELTNAEDLQRKNARFPRSREVDSSSVQQDWFGVLAQLLRRGGIRKEPAKQEENNVSMLRNYKSKAWILRSNEVPVFVSRRVVCSLHEVEITRTISCYKVNGR